ncbi:MAG: DUF5723 family protein [Flavobacteriaceae bacterium]
MKKSILFIFIVMSLFKGLSQNKPILYDFTEVPQSLMLNPGAEVNHKWHIGVPALSGTSLSVGLRGFRVTDLFAKDGLDINAKLEKLIFKLNPSDNIVINQQIEFLNVGIRLPNEKDYLSFGFYEELNFIGYYPKDLAIFLFEGNKDIGRVFNAESVRLKADLVGVFHIGINRRFSDKFIAGARFKLYSGALDIKSIKNTGLFFTTKGIDNIYRHNLQNINLKVQTSGFFIGDDYDENFYKKLFSKVFFGGNLGFGLDMGLTYKPNKQTKITASVQDLGFIKYTKQVIGAEVKGNFATEGVELQTPIVSGIDYFKQIIDDVEASLDSQTIYDSYISFREPKINASVGYSFGLPHLEECFKPRLDNPYRNQIGMQFFSIVRPKQPQLATTIFYYRRVNKYLRTKLTYTVDSYSPSSVGFGLSSHIGHFNLYGSFINLFGANNFYNSNYNAFQFGMNVIF